MLFIDLRKAFDSIEHWVLKDTLKHYGLEKDSIKFIMNLYTDLEAYDIVVTPFGATKTFTLQRGVRQGDGLSPILFNIAINPILERIQQIKLGYKFSNNNQIQIPLLAYADDIILITENAKDMNIIFKIFKSMTDTYGLRINNLKSKYTSIEDIQPIEYTNHSNQKTKIQTLSKDEAYKFLGIYIKANLSWDKDINIFLTTFKSRMTKINRKNAPMQQI